MAQAQTADDVWRLLGELIEAQKETERRFQEAEHPFQETERLLKIILNDEKFQPRKW